LPEPDVLVVGAGLAGLTAAAALADRGRTVRLLDKAAGPGGRLATRRIDGATLDHGAQFFTVRSDEFTSLTRRWRAGGVPIEQWSSGFVQASDIRDGHDGITSTGGDGHARYSVRGGMNELARALARDLAVGRPPARFVPGEQVTAVWVRDGRWHVAATGADGPSMHRAGALLCTPPVPQTLALFARGGTRLSTQIAATLDAITYDPCLALLVVLDGDPVLRGPGGVQFASGPVRWLADNARKDVSARPAITVHASGPWSRAWFDADDDEVGSTLHAWLRPWLGDARVVASQITRWRYAQPRDLVEQAALATDIDGAHVAFAGDAFGHARVEGAARSGLAAAEALLGG